MQDLKPKTLRPTHKPFKAYEPGYLHIDVKYLPQMAEEERRRYLFVAIDRATRWVFVRIYPAKTAANARRFLRNLERAAPMGVTRVLTDNGKEFTDRLCGLLKRAATGKHEGTRARGHEGSAPPAWAEGGMVTRAVRALIARLGEPPDRAATTARQPSPRMAICWPFMRRGRRGVRLGLRRRIEVASMRRSATSPVVPARVLTAARRKRTPADHPTGYLTRKPCASARRWISKRRSAIGRGLQLAVWNAPISW